MTPGRSEPRHCRAATPPTSRPRVSGGQVTVNGSKMPGGSCASPRSTTTADGERSICNCSTRGWTMRSSSGWPRSVRRHGFHRAGRLHPGGSAPGRRGHRVPCAAVRSRHRVRARARGPRPARQPLPDEGRHPPRDAATPTSAGACTSSAVLPSSPSRPPPKSATCPEARGDSAVPARRSRRDGRRPPRPGRTGHGHDRIHAAGHGSRLVTPSRRPGEPARPIFRRTASSYPGREAGSGKVQSAELVRRKGGGHHTDVVVPPVRESRMLTGSVRTALSPGRSVDPSHRAARGRRSRLRTPRCNTNRLEYCSWTMCASMSGRFRGPEARMGTSSTTISLGSVGIPLVGLGHAPLATGAGGSTTRG